MAESVETSLPELQYSGAAASFVVGAGFATLGLVVATPVAVWLQAVLVLGIGAAMLDACRTVARHGGARGVRALRVTRNRHVRVEHGDGRRAAGTLRDGCFVAPWLTIVRWRPEGARFDRTIVVLPDMMPPEEFRKLRVLLKWA